MCVFLPEGQTNLLVVTHLDLNIHSVREYPGAVLGDQQLHVHLDDHLKDDNSQADFEDVDSMRCLDFWYV